jgi:hypothetical protein
MHSPRERAPGFNLDSERSVRKILIEREIQEPTREKLDRTRGVWTRPGPPEPHGMGDDIEVLSAKPDHRLNCVTRLPKLEPATVCDCAEAGPAGKRHEVEGRLGKLIEAAPMLAEAAPMPAEAAKRRVGLVMTVITWTICFTLPASCRGTGRSKEPPHCIFIELTTHPENRRSVHQSVTMMARRESSVKREGGVVHRA